MQSVQRQFGKLMKRSTDESQVGLLLKDFDDADKILGGIIDSTKSWRDAWSSILAHQSRMVTEFEALYEPIVGSSDTTTSNFPAPTPEATMTRTRMLKNEYEELKKDLDDDIATIDSRMITPAMEARDCLTPVKKTIKKRQDRKLDYERYQGRVDSYNKKTKRSDRDNASLAKAESDLARATEEYHAADEHLRHSLPPLITAVFSMLSHLVNTQIGIQNTLLANYYTVLFNYCEQAQFSSNPPDMDETVAQWERLHLPVREEVENFASLANGKAVRSSSNDQRGNSNFLNGRLTSGIINKHRNSNNSTVNGTNTNTNSSSPIQHRLPLATSPTLAPAYEQNKPPAIVYGTKPKSRLSDYPEAVTASTSSTYLTPNTSSPNDSHLPSSTSPSTRTDYFSGNPLFQSSGNNASPGYNAMGAIAKKKPPPPPKPRGSSSNLAMFVTALYDFGGQSEGDLSFREGDRIRVLKKTDSTDDWWEGELRGVQGSFPANYVE